MPSTYLILPYRRPRCLWLRVSRVQTSLVQTLLLRRSMKNRYSPLYAPLKKRKSARRLDWDLIQEIAIPQYCPVLVAAPTFRNCTVFIHKACPFYVQIKITFKGEQSRRSLFTIRYSNKAKKLQLSCTCKPRPSQVLLRYRAECWCCYKYRAVLRYRNLLN